MVNEGTPPSDIIFTPSVTNGPPDAPLCGELIPQQHVDRTIETEVREVLNETNNHSQKLTAYIRVMEHNKEGAKHPRLHGDKELAH